jgi:hypothetical protein
MTEERVYPGHIYDPLRRKIAEGYIRGELRKLLPGTREAGAWRAIDADVARWFEGPPVFSPVRDFWNAVDALSCGIRLKHVVPWITSAHIAWEEREVAIEELTFGASFREFAPIGRHPAAAQARDWFLDPAHAAELASLREAQARQSAFTVLRDQVPILILPRAGDEPTPFVVSDGNRRVLQAALAGRDRLPAYVGTQTGDPLLHEAWVPTSLLITLVSLHRLSVKDGTPRTAEIVTLITDLVRDSSAGRYEFVHRCLVASREDDLVLWTAAAQGLRKHGAELEAPA